MKFLTTILATTLLFASCGKVEDSGWTTLKFSAVDDFGDKAVQVLESGIMVYAVNASNPGKRGAEKFTNENDTTNSSALRALPNGDWYFMAIGYTIDFVSEMGASTLKCAVANGGNPVSLTGGSKTVGLTLSSANCDHDLFRETAHRGSDSTNRIKETSVSICTTASFSSASSGSATCSAASANTGSFLVALPSYELKDYLSLASSDVSFDVSAETSTISKCFSGSSVTELLIPFGNRAFFNSMAPFVVVVSMYASGNTSCSGTPAKTGVLVGGLSGADFDVNLFSVNNSRAKFKTNSSSTPHHIMFSRQE